MFGNPCRCACIHVPLNSTRYSVALAYPKRTLVFQFRTNSVSDGVQLHIYIAKWFVETVFFFESKALWYNRHVEWLLRSNTYICSTIFLDFVWNNRSVLLVRSFPIQFNIIILNIHTSTRFICRGNSMNHVKVLCSYSICMLSMQL